MGYDWLVKLFDGGKDIVAARMEEIEEIGNMAKIRFSL